MLKRIAAEVHWPIIKRINGYTYFIPYILYSFARRDATYGKVRPVINTSLFIQSTITALALPPSPTATPSSSSSSVSCSDIVWRERGKVCVSLKLSLGRLDSAVYLRASGRVFLLDGASSSWSL